MVSFSKYGLIRAILIANCVTIDAEVVAGVTNVMVSCDFVKSGVSPRIALEVPGGFGGVELGPPFGL